MKTVFIFLLSLLSISVSYAQGKYSGSKQKLVGAIYTDSRNVSGLEKWEFQSGSVVSPFDDPEMIIACVFRKENTRICFFSIKEDPASEVYTIMDVLEVKNVLKGWQLKTTSCRQNKVENVEVVALVKWSPTQELLKPAKQAWRFNRDKRKFEILSIKGIDCLNEGVE